MVNPLPHDLFKEGEPLRSDNWNQLVDASASVVDSMSAEHRDGVEHASGRFEQAFMALEWNGSQWDVVRSERLELHQNFPVDALTDELELGFQELYFFTGWDYGALVVTEVGVVGVMMESPNADVFRLNVPRGDSFNLERLMIIVYGKRAPAS